jgi:cyanate permease
MLGPLAVAAILPRHQPGAPAWARSLGEVVRLRRFWILIVVSISINICWHFLVNWVPIYLKKERHLTDAMGNYLSAVTFLAADIGNLSGGWLSRRLAVTGMSVVRARKLVMSLCMLLIMVGPGLSVAQSDTSAMVLLSIMAAGTAAFMANYFAFTQEVSARQTGFVVGYLGGVGNLFVAGYQPFAGWLRDATGSFAPNFLIVGLAPLIGLAALLWGWTDRQHEPRNVIDQPP